jgi:hypothetical protein
MPDTDPFASAGGQYSIVVAGNMNPAIHHPGWYKAIRAMSDDELAPALGPLQSPPVQPTGSERQGQGVFRALSGSALTVVTPALAQFTVGPISITCLEQTWTIATINADLVSRICEIACAVFESLSHTPVSAYGFNLNAHRRTTTQNVGLGLAELLDATPVGLIRSIDSQRTAKIAYTNIDETGRRLTVSMEQSATSADAVFVAINAHHPITVTPEEGFRQFDLTPLLRSSSDRDRRDADELLTKVVSIFGTQEN